MKRRAVFVLSGLILASIQMQSSRAAWPGVNGLIVALGPCESEGEVTNGILVMDHDGSDRNCIVGFTDTHASASPYGPRWSPDGGRIAFVASGDLYICDADGSDVERITIGREIQGTVSWSPNGSQMLFTFNQNIWIMNADGTDQRRLAYRGEQPAWSPDGRKIAFVDFMRSDDRHRNGNQIFTMRADGSGRKRLTRGIRPGNFPAWSPDGRRIVFTRGSFPRAVLVTMRRNGTLQREVTRGRHGDIEPAWSPDGRWLVFVRGLYLSEPYLMKIRSNGRALTTLTEEEWFQTPDWQPL